MLLPILLIIGINVDNVRQLKMKTVYSASHILQLIT